MKNIFTKGLRELTKEEEYYTVNIIINIIKRLYTKRSGRALEKETGYLSTKSSSGSAAQGDRGKHKRVFGRVEAVFDGLYLLAAACIGFFLLVTGGTQAARLAGSTAILLAGGDMFHLVPRMGAILTGDEMRWSKAMGAGKFITSLTMTGFYLLLWKLGLLLFQAEDSVWGRMTGLVWLLAVIRVVICLFPQNQWLSPTQPVSWGIARNVPFLLQGGLVGAIFFAHVGAVPAVDGMWVAVALSFLFYLPVVLWAGKKPMVGMLMLPKTMAYLWMLIMCISL